MNKYVTVFLSCWALGLAAGLFLGQSQNKTYTTDLDFHKFLSTNVISGITVSSPQQMVHSVEFCDKRYTYAADGMVHYRQIPLKEERFSFSTVSAASVSSALSFLGVTIIKPQEILALSKSDWRIGLAAILGVGTGLGIGYYIGLEDICEQEGIDFEKSHAYFFNAKNWEFVKKVTPIAKTLHLNQ